MEKPRGIIFDLDGTLLDTLEDLADSVNTVLAGEGCPVHPAEAYRYFVGDGASVLIGRVLPEMRQDKETHARCLARFREEYAVRWNLKTRPYEGIAEMLSQVRALGIRMAVLSNKPHDATVQCVTELLRGAEFDMVQGQQEGVPRKPDPAGALAIARALHFPPEHFWYLGDTGTDMQTAVSAGMFAVGAAWGFRTKDELERNGAQVILESPRQLIGLLDGKRGL
jgi:phosphoglycolate phosphatase